MVARAIKSIIEFSSLFFSFGVLAVRVIMEKFKFKSGVLIDF